jgi:hypothetical protein
MVYAQASATPEGESGSNCWRSQLRSTVLPNRRPLPGGTSSTVTRTPSATSATTVVRSSSCPRKDSRRHDKNSSFQEVIHSTPLVGITRGTFGITGSICRDWYDLVYRVFMSDDPWTPPRPCVSSSAKASATHSGQRIPTPTQYAVCRPTGPPAWTDHRGPGPTALSTRDSCSPPSSRW